MKHQILNSYTKLLLTFILLILSTTTKAQSNNYQYQPMAIEGATWVYHDDYYSFRFGYHLNGDTIINGVEYKKGFDLNFIPSSNDSIPFITITYNVNFPSFFIRDDTINKKVYSIWLDVYQDFNCQNTSNYTDEFLLYDFNTEVNDTAYYCTENNYLNTVSEIDTVEYFGYEVPRRFIATFVLYEKIGNSSGLFSDFRDFFISVPGPIQEHYCVGSIEDCTLNLGPLATQEINDNPNLIIYPNPANSEIHFTSDVDLESLAIFSMTGQLVKSVEDINLKDPTIDISNLQSQTYAVLIKQKDGEYIRKIFIKY